MGNEKRPTDKDGTTSTDSPDGAPAAKDTEETAQPIVDRERARNGGGRIQIPGAKIKGYVH